MAVVIAKNENSSKILTVSSPFAIIKKNDEVRYSITNITVQNNDTVYLCDRTINTVTFEQQQTELNVNFPALIQGKARDFFLSITCNKGISCPKLKFTGVTLANSTGKMPEIADGDANKANTTILYFTEIAANVFLVKSEFVETINQD